MKRISFALMILFAFGVNLQAEVATWNIDSSHANAQFSVRHLMVSNVKGEFGKVTGVLQLDDQDLNKSKVEASIDATTINSREPKRDAHLKSADFFDVEKYPILTFKSRKIAKDANGKFKVTGDLTIKNVTKEAVLTVDGPTAQIKDPWGNFRRGASATTRVNRRDFGLTWNKALETGGVVVGDEVDISIDVELVKQVTPTASVSANTPKKQ